MEAAIKKNKGGRPKKALPDTMVSRTIEFRKADYDYIEKVAQIQSVSVAIFLRRAAATHAGLVPLVTQQHQDMVKMREMMEDIQRQLRVIARFQGKTVQKQEDDSDDSASAVEGFTPPDFSFADQA